MPERTATRTWIVLALLASSQILAYVDRVNLSVAGPDLVQSGAMSAAWLGTLFSVFNWVFTLSLMLAGPVADRVGAGKSLAIGLTTWSLATALSGLTKSFLPLAVCRGFVGLGESTMIPAGSRIIEELVPRERRALAIGTFFAGNKVGLALGIPLSSLLLAHFGWHAVFLVTGALGAIWLAGWATCYRPPEARERPASTRDAALRWRGLLRHRTTWGVMLGQAGYLYMYYVFVTWLPGYLVLQRKMSVLQTGFVGALPFIVGVVCTIAGGWIGDRLVRCGAPATRVRKSFAVGALLSATLFTVCAAYAAETVVAVTCLTLAVGSFSLCTGHINAIPLDVAPKQSVSSLVSLQNFGGNVGGSLAPILTGFMISSTGNFQVPLLVTAAVALVFGCGGYGLVVGNLEGDIEGYKAATRPRVVIHATPEKALR